VPLKLLFALLGGSNYCRRRLVFDGEAGAKLNFGLKSGHQLHRAQRSFGVTFLLETFQSITPDYATLCSSTRAFGARYSFPSSHIA
jgi:hypothetical protein